ncbi:MAG: hypothetical protein R3298_13350, partial [Gammaproteobacteria bacterium]|nr:hypothetical protein [Gammaproteobacteria bacterium]
MGHAARLAEARDPRNDIYPTRGSEERVLDRVDPVVHGDGTPQGPHSLSRDQLDRYARDGFLVVPGVFSRNEVDALYEEYVRLADSDRLDGREELVLEPDSDLPRSIFSPHRFSALYDRL